VRFPSRNIPLAVLAFVFPALVCAAVPITGTVTNQTSGKPSAGDDVTLIRLAQGMQESTHTTTDSHGHFTLDVPDDGLHLVRVTHDKANYFRPVPPGTQSVDIDVYNAAPHVKGISTEADVMRIQTDPTGSSVIVVENFFVKNDSTPPMTQFSSNPFDFYLPDGAVVDRSAALAPGGMPVQAAPVPLQERGHYSFIFPIRPGETRFQITYHFPYRGKLDFVPKLTADTGTVAIMLPKGMTVTPAPGSPLQAVDDEVSAQTYVAKGVTPRSPLSFTLTGTGQLPRDEQEPGGGGSAAGQQAENGGAPVASTEDTRPGSGLQNPLDPDGTRDPWGKYKYWILGGLVVLLAAAAGVILRKPAAIPARAVSVAAKPETQRERMLMALKEELFALETERLTNAIPEADYVAQKTAIETVLRRALARTGSDEGVA
jgi:hypothetical protein